MAKATFSLDTVSVASPCQVPWDGMDGDGRVRFCPLCRHKVYNLSEMGRREAEHLVRQSEGRLCIRFYRRRDGTVMTRDCPVGLQAVRRRLAIFAGVAAAALFAVFGGGAALLGAARSQSSLARQPSTPFQAILDWFNPPPIVMGAICPPTSSGLLGGPNGEGELDAPGDLPQCPAKE